MFLIFEITMYKINIRAFLANTGGSAVKNLPDNARDVGSIPGLGEGNVKPLQYSCLENPMDRGAWQATVHKVI